jgi:hypothetical protein
LRGSACKQKGKYFEDVVAKKVSAYLNLKKHQCYRSPFSGNGPFEYGDIKFSDPSIYDMVLECKFHNNWDIRALYPNLGATIQDFVSEVFVAAEKYEHDWDKKPRFWGVVLSKPYYPIYYITSIRSCEDIPVIITGNKIDISPIYVYDFCSYIESDILPTYKGDQNK